MRANHAFTLTVIPAETTAEFVNASLMVLSRGLPPASLDSCFDDLNKTSSLAMDKALFVGQWERYLNKIQANRIKLGYLDNNTVGFPETDLVFSQVLEQFYASTGSFVVLESA